MKNLSEEELKIKFNNYMEQIKVPENLGGIIMEDFEKMKNEENQENVQNVEQRTNENAQNVNSESNVKKKKNHTALKISLGSVAAVVLVGTGIFVGTKLTGNKTVIFDNHSAQNGNMAGENQKEVKSDITAEESKKIVSFLNNSINNPFTQTNYTSPEELLKNIDKSHEFVLRYAIFNLNNTYATPITSSQKSRLNLEDMPYKFISEENLIKFLKEKMNYTYTTEELRDVFTYKESEKGYLDMISDSCQSNVTIKDGCYKLGNKYYITVNNEDNKEIELVLLENDNSYYFYSAKVKNIAQNNAKENNEQNSISNAEISEIENFINDFKNQAFALTNYDNPEDLLKHEQNMYNIDRILSYSIKQSNYAIPANAEQNKAIWKNTNGEAMISTRVVDIKDIVKFLKEKTNYNYSEAEVRNCFKVNSDLDKYVIQISDTIFINYKVKNVTKNGDRYSVKLYVPDSERAEETDVDIVLTKDNGKYYFYSCNLNNFKKISQEKTTQLESFINDPGNHAFVYMNYNNSNDLISETYDAKKAQNIIQSLIEGGYAKSITDQELKIVGKQEKPTYTISLEDLDKFLQEKTNTGFDQDALKKAFKYEYNEELGKLVIQTAGALDKDNKIVDGYKAGNYEYWLTLSKGQEVVLFERINGEIFFESCTGYKNQ